jgi:hypothetical protein
MTGCRWRIGGTVAAELTAGLRPSSGAYGSKGTWFGERGPRLLTVAAVTWVAGWLFAIMFAPNGFIQGRFEDGGVYYLAGRAFLNGQSYYASPDFRQWPLVAAIWAPIALIPPASALRGWVLFTIVALVGSAALLLREYGPAARPPPAWLIFTVAGPATLFMLYLGQMSGVCCAAYLTGLALLRRRPVPAGICFALMAAKPHLVLLALPALATASLPALLSFAGAMTLWPFGSLLVGGPAVFRTFLLQIYAVRDTTIGLVTSSLSSLVPLRGDVHAVVQTVLLALILLGAAGLAVRRLRGAPMLTPLQVDLAAALILAALPYALVSDLLFLLPLLLRLGRRPARPAWLVALAWWALPWLATLLTSRGAGGLAAVLPPLIALAGWKLLAQDPLWLCQPPLTGESHV